MELIERDIFLAVLQSKFKDIAHGEGHCIFVSGEAGIGKTSLVRNFCNEQKENCTIYQGACDALFTPRPLAPLYDIMWQIKKGLWPGSNTIEERPVLFAEFLGELRSQKGNVLIVFEDVHWADEATLDFIKFFVRRIALFPCLFIVTYRDDEIYSGHPLRNVLGQLPPDSFCRLQLTPLSRQAVDAMAHGKGYNGEDVYTISGGNPFYVNEILASYSPGVPDKIKDAILSVYSRQSEKTKNAWEILSILPNGFMIDYLGKSELLHWTEAIKQSLDTKILVLKDGKLFFKHELYRRTIEATLSPSTRVCYNKKMLEAFRETFEQDREIEKIIHLAKNANEYDVVVYYAPLAAKKAASVGAHIEASKLYFTALQCYQGNDDDILLGFYEAYAYECYLTNQLKEAITYTEKSFHFWKKRDNKERIGNSLRFLSRLWWFDGNRKNAEYFAEQAIEVLRDQPSSRAKAMAYSNMSQLKLLADQTDACIAWGEKAIAIAEGLNDEETIAHALNSMGSALMTVQRSMPKGIGLLQQSLQIAIKNCYHEHVARAYTALGSNGVTMKDYLPAKKALDEGIQYCEDNELDSLRLYMLSWKARLNLETGNWNESYSIAEGLIKNEDLAPVVEIGALVVVATIKIRKGDPDALPLLLKAKAMAFETMELQRIIPVLSALLELEWISGKCYIDTAFLDSAVSMIAPIEKISKKNKLYYWLRKARKEYLPLQERYEGYEVSNVTAALSEAAFWEQKGCPYEQALSLFEGGDDDKRKAITIALKLGANAVCQKMKLEMRTSGIKNIPQGIRKSTRSNPALLTGRELDVLQLLKQSLQNKEIADMLYISPKTVDHHISSILFKLDVNSRTKAVREAIRYEIIK